MPKISQLSKLNINTPVQLIAGSGLTMDDARALVINGWTNPNGVDTTITWNPVASNNTGIFAPRYSEVMRRNRFVITFPDHINIPTAHVQSIDMPRFVSESIELADRDGMIRYVNANSHWTDITLKIVSVVAPSSAQSIYEFIINNMNINQRTVKFDFGIKELDPVGAIVQEWYIRGAFVTEINYGTNDYANDNISEISVTVRPEYCELLH